MGNLTAKSWTPTNVIQAGSDVPGLVMPGGTLDAGDWIQLTVSYRATNATPVVHTPGRFLIHAIFTPNTDDSTPHQDVASTYGGSPTAVNRRPNYHVDPGVWFQVPSTGTISVIAGGLSDPAVVVDLVLRRQHTPRNGELLAARLANEQAQAMERALEGDEQAILQVAGFSPVNLPIADRIWPPPIVGTPQLVPSTWVDIPATTPLNVPDGAVLMKSTVAAGGALTIPTITFTTQGNTYRVFLPPGIPVDIGMLAQGFACSDGVVATWQSDIALAAATFLSSLGG